MLQEQEEVLQPGSSLGDEPSNLIRLEVALDKSGRLTPMRYDVVNDVLYTDVNSFHPDGFTYQEVLKITARSLDPYCQRVWEITGPQRHFHKKRYEQDMRDMTGIPPEIQKDVADAEREEVITESKPVHEKRPAGQQIFSENGEPLLRPQGQQSEPSAEQSPIQFIPPAIDKEVVILNMLVSDGRSAIEDLGQLFELYVEDEKIKAFGASVVKRMQRKYYECGVSEVNPDAEPGASEGSEDD